MMKSTLFAMSTVIITEAISLQPGRGGLVNPREFYNKWDGHDVGMLKKVYDGLMKYHTEKNEGKKPSVLFTAGDSSLDNKAWIGRRAPCVNGHHEVFEQNEQKQDVAYWINAEMEQRRMNAFALCGSVEASTVGWSLAGLINAKATPRGWNWLNPWKTNLLEQDYFIQERITENDYLVVSVGGNDIALAPSIGTFLSAMKATKASIEDIQAGKADGYQHFVKLFKDKVQNYVETLLDGKHPKKVLICTIYHPSDLVQESWANFALNFLGYDANPYQLRALIDQIFLDATSQITLKDGKGNAIEVVPVPLFQALDPENLKEYDNRCEPSEVGGHKMAEQILDFIDNPLFAKTKYEEMYKARKAFEKTEEQYATSNAIVKGEKRDCDFTREMQTQNMAKHREMGKAAQEVQDKIESLEAANRALTMAKTDPKFDAENRVQAQWHLFHEIDEDLYHKLTENRQSKKWVEDSIELPAANERAKQELAQAEADAKESFEKIDAEGHQAIDDLEDWEDEEDLKAVYRQIQAEKESVKNGIIEAKSFLAMTEQNLANFKKQNPPAAYFQMLNKKTEVFARYGINNK